MKNNEITQKQQYHLDRLWMKSLKKALQIDQRSRKLGLLRYPPAERLPK